MSEVKRFRKASQLDARSAVTNSKTHGQLKRRLLVRAVKHATNSVNGGNAVSGGTNWAVKRRHRANAIKQIRAHSTSRANFRGMIRSNLKAMIGNAATMLSGAKK